ncbi:uncharacterized protein [Bemisia tabaci]|uniref:uncharacterized protein n=1 Tax=Bemisia tabaci TaxID=7038 RepID=UPI003B28C668
MDEMAEWDKEDGAAQKYIFTTVNKRLITHIMNCGTAEDMMNKLQEILEKDYSKKKCTLIQEFHEISYNKSDSISEYISEVENLAQRINSIKENSTKDDMIIAKILTTLPENYEPFVSAWESTEIKEQTLTNLTCRLMGEETRKKKQKNEKDKSL